jgi:hypothetical protein
MGVEVRTIKVEDGISKPKPGDTVRHWYIAYIYDEETPKKKGRM